jgi:Protein of unknown function (DUF4038)/Putative collagen-binding domain of a collagenase
MSKLNHRLVALIALCFLGGCLVLATSPRVWNRIGRELFPLKPASFSNTGSAHFPLKKAPGGRHLVDQDGKPFLMIADSPWGLVGDLSTEEASTYFKNRASLGFNSVLIAIAVSDYAGSKIGGYETFDGLPPFVGGTRTTPGRLTNPYEAYWRRVDAMIKLAGKHGLNVIAYPMETGGWLSIMEAAGVDDCYQYGAFLGNRYKDFPNIIWALGNDYNQTSWSVPAIDAVVIAVANGILSKDNNHLVTIELGSPANSNQNFGQSSSTDNRDWWSILGLNWAYSYLPMYATVKLNWQDGFIPVIPYVMGESGYESESWSGVEGTPKTCRRESWCSLTGGGLAGVVYGNHYIWYFASGGQWQANLNTPGAIQSGYVRSFFEGLKWWKLRPDYSHKFCTAGYGTEFTDLTSPSTKNASGQSYISVDGYAPAMITTDGTLGIVYVQNRTTLTIDMSMMSGKIDAAWYDPTNNSYSFLGTYENSGARQFLAPAANSAGDQDFVLLLTTHLVKGERSGTETQ